MASQLKAIAPPLELRITNSIFIPGQAIGGAAMLGEGAVTVITKRPYLVGSGVKAAAPMVAVWMSTISPVSTKPCSAAGAVVAPAGALKLPLPSRFIVFLPMRTFAL